MTSLAGVKQMQLLWKNQFMKTLCWPHLINCKKDVKYTRQKCNLVWWTSFINFVVVVVTYVSQRTKNSNTLQSRQHVKYFLKNLILKWLSGLLLWTLLHFFVIWFLEHDRREGQSLFHYWCFAIFGKRHQKDNFSFLPFFILKQVKWAFKILCCSLTTIMYFICR